MLGTAPPSGAAAPATGSVIGHPRGPPRAAEVGWSEGRGRARLGHAEVRAWNLAASPPVRSGQVALPQTVRKHHCSNVLCVCVCVFACVCGMGRGGACGMRYECAEVRRGRGSEGRGRARRAARGARVAAAVTSHDHHRRRRRRRRDVPDVPHTAHVWWWRSRHTIIIVVVVGVVVRGSEHTSDRRPQCRWRGAPPNPRSHGSHVKRK